MKILKNLVLFFILPVVLIIILFTQGLIAGFAGVVIYLLFAVYKLRPSIYQYIGTTNYSKGNLEEAVRWYKKASETKGAKTITKISYGYLQLKAGNIEEAESIINAVLAGKPNKDMVMYAKSNLALVLWKKGQIEEAVEMLENVMKDYKTTTIYGSLGYMYILKGDLEKALVFNIEAYEYNNSNPVILDNLGQTYLMTNEIEKAEEIYEKLMALSKAPAFPEAYYNYSLLLEKKGNMEKALEMAKKALDYKVSTLSTITREMVEERVKSLSSIEN